MKPRHFAIATRASPLAVCQAQWVAIALQAQGHSCELCPTRTSGDVSAADVSAADTDITGERPAQRSETDGKEAFVDRVRQLVLDGSCALAVHSLKDLPTETHPQLRLIAVPMRAAAADVLVAQNADNLRSLPPTARIGTASLRRQALLRQARPDLTPLTLRGNVQTRLEKMRAGQCEALILAQAGLERLGLEEVISEAFALSEWPCSPGQGALAVECSTEDAAEAAFAEALLALEHRPTRLCTDAERAFSRAMGADCRAPLAAWCRSEAETLRLTGFVGSASGAETMRDEMVAAADGGAEALGEQLADKMQRAGATRLLEAP